MAIVTSAVTFLVALGAIAASGFAVWQDYENRANVPRWYYIDLQDTIIKAALFIGGLCVFATWLRVVS